MLETRSLKSSIRYSRRVSSHDFHFITRDRSLGGHVLELKVGAPDLSLQVESDLHIALPESDGFLAADLNGEDSAELDEAEAASRQS